MKPDTSQEKESEFPVSITDRRDGWLMRQWKSGDERAAEVLFDRYAIRLVALVASRLNRRYQAAIDPNEVAQSAMGSFFDAAKHSRIQVSDSVSLWRLLATFARRKMARSIERQSAVKRGGDQTRVSLNEVPPQQASEICFDTEDETDELIATLKAELPQELFVVVEGVLGGQTQRELAESLGIDERTVRRRLSRVRELLVPGTANAKNVAHAATSPPTLPRVSYNEFVLGKLIGSGGFGKVYLASMQSDGRTVAIKFLRKVFWQNEVARQTFLREINIASQINHPGVIRYLGYGESPHGGPYVASEWIDGKSLQEVDDATPQHYTGWLRQICEAVQAVHQAGLVHGDLTPSNVLVDAQDRITITDFGLSQAPTELVSSILGGTLGFAAPEQISSSFGSISIKTDIYAIGGLVHWFCFGRPPNAGKSLEDALAKTLSLHEPETQTSDAIAEPLRSILIATLHKSPADRTISIADIIALLDSATD